MVRNAEIGRDFLGGLVLQPVPEAHLFALRQSVEPVIVLHRQGIRLLWVERKYGGLVPGAEKALFVGRFPALIVIPAKAGTQSAPGPESPDPPQGTSSR